MKISITISGALDQKNINKWILQKRRAIREAVKSGMDTGGKQIAQNVRAKMQSVFAVRKAGFVKSMRHKVYARNPEKLPSLFIGSKIPWLGIHRGGTIVDNMLIPLLPAHQRMGRKAFRRVIDGLLRTGNAFVVQKDGKAILMAESIKENESELIRFKRAERIRTGAARIKRGQEIPIAVLVRRVSLKRRLDLADEVRSSIPVLMQAIQQELAKEWEKSDGKQ